MSLDLGWIEKMANGKGEPDDRLVHCIALRARITAKQLIMRIFRK